MPKAGLPSNEAERLKELQSYRILDSLSQAEYDQIVMLASHICNTPISLVSLVDVDRQWFKAKVGLDAEETPRDLAFCAHAILKPDDILIVEDATKDPRFSDNELVTSEPNIRFYAGCPLVTPKGLPIGTLCVIDMEPKVVHEEQVNALRILSQNVITLLELRKSQYQKEDLIENLKLSNKDLEEYAHVASHDLKTPLHNINQLAEWIERDVQDYASDETKEYLQLLRQRTNRMQTLVNDLLEYSKVGKKIDKENFEIVNLNDLIQEIISLIPVPQKFSVKVADDFKNISVQKMPLKQVIFNLITNAIKHHDKPEGLIELGYSEDDRTHYIHIMDNGPGIAKEYQNYVFEKFKTLKSKDEVEGSGMGLAIVQKALNIYGGGIGLESQLEQGCKFTVKWPKKSVNKQVKDQVQKVIEVD